MPVRGGVRCERQERGVEARTHTLGLRLPVAGLRLPRCRWPRPAGLVRRAQLRPGRGAQFLPQIRPSQRLDDFRRTRLAPASGGCFRPSHRVTGLGVHCLDGPLVPLAVGHSQAPISFVTSGDSQSCAAVTTRRSSAERTRPASEGRASSRQRPQSAHRSRLASGWR